MDCTTCKAGAACSTCGKKDDASTLIAATATPTGPKAWEYFHFSTPLTALTPLQSLPVAIKTFPDSYMVIKKLLAIGTVNPLAAAANAFTAQFYNSSTGRTMMSLPVNARNLFGSVDIGGLNSSLPNNLKDPIVFPPSANLQIQLTDLSNAPNNVQLTFAGYRFYDLTKPPVQKRAGARLEWFQQVGNAVMTANGQSQIQLTTDADADFMVWKIMLVTADAFRYLISDSSSKEDWFDQPMDSALGSGNAAFPFWLPKPRIIKANSNINIQIQNTGGTGGALQFVLEGSKVYR